MATGTDSRKAESGGAEVGADLADAAMGNDMRRPDGQKRKKPQRGFLRLPAAMKW